MTPKEIRDLAHELHFIVDYDSTGQIILLTGVHDESKRDDDEVEEVIDMYGGDDFISDGEEDVFDPVEDEEWDPGDHE